MANLPALDSSILAINSDSHEELIDEHDLKAFKLKRKTKGSPFGFQ